MERVAYAAKDFTSTIEVAQLSPDNMSWKVFPAKIGEELPYDTLAYCFYNLRDSEEPPPDDVVFNAMTPKQWDHSLTHLPKRDDCPICHRDMQKRPSRRIAEPAQTRAFEFGERIHMDLVGAIRELDDKYYAFVARDDASSMLWATILEDKTPESALEAVEELMTAWPEIKPGSVFMTDNGAEFGGSDDTPS